MPNEKWKSRTEQACKLITGHWSNNIDRSVEYIHIYKILFFFKNIYFVKPFKVRQSGRIWTKFSKTIALRKSDSYKSSPHCISLLQRNCASKFCKAANIGETGKKLNFCKWQRNQLYRGSFLRWIRKWTLYFAQNYLFATNWWKSRKNPYFFLFSAKTNSLSNSAQKTTRTQLVSLPFAKVQFLLLYDTFVYSFSATEKRSEVKFCTRVWFPRCNGCAKFRSDRPSS